MKCLLFSSFAEWFRKEVPTLLAISVSYLLLFMLTSTLTKNVILIIKCICIKIEKIVASIWKLLCPVQLVNILAPASLMILEHSQQKQLTWDRVQ